MFFGTIAHSSRELLFAETYPGVGGLSGTSWRKLSRYRLKVMGSFSSLIGFGIRLKQQERTPGAEQNVDYA